MNVATFRDIGSLITSKAGGAGTATAAGTGDATEVSGPYVDRQDHLSAKLVITYKAVLQQDETLSFAANFQDASDGVGTGVADYGDALAAAVVATGGAGGSTEQGTVELDVDLSGAKQFVRAQVTPDLSAAGVDTLTWAAAIVCGPKGETPNQ